MNRRKIYQLRRMHYSDRLPAAQGPAAPIVPAREKEAAPSREKELVGKLQDQLLRLRAEFENYRKRVQREQANVRNFANEGLVKKLLVVMDDVDRALGSAENTDNVDAVVSGVKIIREHFWSQLEAAGVSRIPTDGEPFDPNLHEAVSTETTDRVAENHIASTFQPGYKLNDRVVRAAMVIVAKKPPAS